MANYPFKINITTKDDLKYSFYTASFATDADTVVSASVMVDRINNMKSGSNFVDSIEAPTSLATHGSTLYGAAQSGVNNGIHWLSASFDHPNTGSITFTDTETAASGGLDFYTFHGTKVCSVLGLPEGIPIYTENFKLSDSSTDTTNYISGEFVSDSIALKKGFKMSSQARMRSNLIWDDVFGEGLIQWVSGSTSKMSMGYNDVANQYFVSAPQITGSVAKLFDVRTHVINGLQTTPQQIKFDPNDITFVENNVETMLMKDSFVMINPNGASGADVDFFCGSSDGTLLIHSDAGNNKVNMAGVLDITNNTDATDSTGDTGALRAEGGASINGISYFGSYVTIDQGLGVGTAGTSTAGLIRATNDVVAYYSSDKRLKDNLIKIGNPLDKISQLNGYEFDWIAKEGIHENEGHDIGVIAQEVEKVIPEIVQTRDNGYKAVKYEKIVPLLIESIKELKQRVEELENGSSK